MQEVILIGAGSAAKAVIAAASHAGIKVRGIFDDDSSRWGTLLLGVPIVGSLAHGEQTGMPAVLGLDDPCERKAAVDKLQLSWVSVIHPAAFLNPSSVTGPGTVIMEGAVIQPNVMIGRHVMIEANATVSHDCVVEDFVCVGPGVDLAGSVRVGQGGARFEVGAVVTPNLRIGAWSTVGPRAAVIRDIPDRVSVDGRPATPS